MQQYSGKMLKQMFKKKKTSVVLKSCCDCAAVLKDLGRECCRQKDHCTSETLPELCSYPSQNHLRLSCINTVPQTPSITTLRSFGMACVLNQVRTILLD